MINRFDLVRTARFMYLVSIAFLIPIQQPLFPLNVIIFDYVNAAFMAFFVIYFVLNRKLELRLVTPLLVILFASLVSMINSEDVLLNIVTLTQEFYLYAFFLVVSNVIRTEREMRIIVGALFISAAASAIPLLQELAVQFTVRAGGYFTDDNGAAAFLGAMAFLAYYPFSRPGRLFKPVFLFLVLSGVFATKSLSGALSYLTGTVVIFVLYWREMGVRTRIRLVLAAVAFGFVVLAVFQEASHLHNYLDRLPNSTGGRTILWKTGFDTFLHNPLGIGIGPARFKEVVIITEATHRKELHSDYLSFLVERGVFGFIGLLLVLGSIMRSLLRALRNQTSLPELRWILGLLGMFVFTLVDAVSHEMLHNRHVWLIYALIVAQERISTDRKRNARAVLPANRGPDDARVVDTRLELV